MDNLLVQITFRELFFLLILCIHPADLTFSPLHATGSPLILILNRQRCFVPLCCLTLSVRLQYLLSKMLLSNMAKLGICVYRGCSLDLTYLSKDERDFQVVFNKC